jgi:ADP-ribose pyrophosphatase
MQKWKLLHSELAFNHRWFKVRQDKVELPSGKVLDDYFVWPEGDVALVIPVTSNKEFVLVQQYKHAAGHIMIEYPAGMVNKEENPEDAARRELEEETGYSSEKLSFLCKLTNNPTKVVGNIYCYLAEYAVKNKETNFDENEEIEVLVKPYEQVIQMAIEGKMWVSGSVAATFLAAKKLQLSL